MCGEHKQGSMAVRKILYSSVLIIYGLEGLNWVEIIQSGSIEFFTFDIWRVRLQDKLLDANKIK